MGLLHLAVSVGVVIAGVLAIRRVRSVRETTLSSTWTWVVLVVTIWTGIWFSDLCARGVSPAMADHFWYAAALFSLCPPMAVLGSRRPGSRVWTWFILFPMLLVLGWPVVTLWMQGSEVHGMQLETPQLVAFCLVLVMGVGNYCGTRYTLSALLYAGAALSLVLCCSLVSPVWLSDRSGARFWSTVLMVLAIFLLDVADRPVPASRFDRLWFDFFDTFGIVWGRRIQDRINYLANKEGLPVKLELDGFVWSPAANRTATSVAGDLTQSGQPCRSKQDTSDSEARVEHFLRWLLRRFVDPQWIDCRLGTRSVQNVNDLTVDS